jgi:hypothetical protein
VLKPPPHVLLAYRFLGWRVGPSYADWVHDDITRRGWLLRQGTPALAAVLLVGGGVNAALDADPSRLLRVLVILAVAGLALRRTLRQRALMQQGLNEDGGVLPEAKWYLDDRRRVQRNLLSAFGTVVLVVGGLTVLAYRSR